MDARGLGLAVPVPQVEEWTGVRTGVRRCMTAAFANGLSDGFWRSLDPSLDDVRPDEQVLSEFPVEAMRLPLVRVDASFTGAHWGHFQTVKDEDGRLRNFAMCEPTVTATVYAKSAIQRDRMLDAYTDMLAFAFTQPMQQPNPNTYGNTQQPLFNQQPQQPYTPAFGNNAPVQPAAAPVAVAAGPVAAAAVEEQTEFDVILTDAGAGTDTSTGVALYVADEADGDDLLAYTSEWLGNG